MPTPPLNISRLSRVPLYRQLEEQLRDAILAARLRPGDRLPSVRELSDQLGVARITIVAAYDQLTAEGYLVGKVGSGTRVALDLPEEALRLRVARMNPLSGTVPATAPPPVRAEVPDEFRAPQSPTRYLMEACETGIDLFPRVRWARSLAGAFRELGEREGGRGLGYVDPRGDHRLREALAVYLAAARGVRCSAEEVLVTRGAQGAFAAIASTWLDRTRSFVVEDPGYERARHVGTATGAKAIGVSVDEFGLRTQELAGIEATLAIVTPSWQHPLGGTMSLARRLELLSWAREHQALVVEDDYDSELRYVGHPITSLQGLDDEGRVLYVGTLSKVMYPGLRIGYVVAPPAVIEPLATTLATLGRPPGVVEQRAAADFVLQGDLDHHIRRLRVAYAERQAALVEAVHEEMSGLAWTAAARAGMHLTLQLTPGLPGASEISVHARRAGIAISAIAQFRLRPGPDDRLFVGYTRVRPLEIKLAIRELASIIRRLVRRSSFSGSHADGRRK